MKIAIILATTLMITSSAYAQQIGVDPSDVVLMEGNAVPATENGEALTLMNLTPAQQSQFASVASSPHSAITWDGSKFSAVPPAAVVAPPAPVSCSGTPTAGFTVTAGVVTHC